MRYKLLLSLLPIHALFAFNYDLHLTLTPGKSSQAMITAHGMGGNYRIAEMVESDKTLVSFNFPDYDMHARGLSAEKTTFGTIDEILPLLYVIKECVVKKGHSEVDLYGFSAGGGALINALAVLNTSRFDPCLAKIGIQAKEKALMLQAIQKGKIILDTPLKSISEVIAFRGKSKDLDLYAKRYKRNGMVPLESLEYLRGLVLQVTLHFQQPDEVLSNRDDALFYQRLKEVNLQGTTHLVIGKDHGHAPPHPSLWNYLKVSVPALIQNMKRA